MARGIGVERDTLDRWAEEHEDFLSAITRASARTNRRGSHMAHSKTKRPRKEPAEGRREQVLAIFADYAEQDVDKLFEFVQHCQIDLEPLSSKNVQLPD